MESCRNFCVYFDKTQYTIALLKHILIIIFCQINCHYNKHSSNNFRTLRGFSITLGFILTYTLTHSLAWWENDPQWWWGVPTNWSSCFLPSFQLNSETLKTFCTRNHHLEFFSAIFAMAWWVLFFVFLIIILQMCCAQRFKFREWGGENNIQYFFESNSKHEICKIIFIIIILSEKEKNFSFLNSIRALLISWFLNSGSRFSWWENQSFNDTFSNFMFTHSVASFSLKFTWSWCSLS